MVQHLVVMRDMVDVWSYEESLINVSVTRLETIPISNERASKR